MSVRHPFDAVVIGGGHNGLVCASYLAGAGMKVRLIEVRDEVGGAAVTESFHPGFRNSTASYTVSLLHPKVIKDLNLAEHGLKIVERAAANFLPLSHNQYLLMGRSLPEIQGEVARFSTRDAQSLPEYYARLERVASVVRELWLKSPVNLGQGGWTGDFLSALSLARLAHKIEAQTRADLLDFFTKSAGDLLDHWFESAPLKAALGFDAIVGHFASPYTPGSAYVLLHHALGEVNGKRGAWGHALGGMGAISAAMRKEAERRGVEILTGCAVTQVCVDQRGAQGVLLADGRLIEGRCVVSAINPKLLYTRLIAPPLLEPDFLRRIKQYHCASGSFRMNVALSELPNFSCLPGNNAALHHQSGIVLAPSLRYMEEAYFDARRLGCSRAPVVELVIPSIVDDSLAPPGQHVASLFCQHFNPVLPNGLDWAEIKEPAADLVIDTVNQYAPNFKASVLGRMVLSPLDLEQRFGLVGGDIFHGALTLDQLWTARPLLGYGAYRGPIAGLYMCSAGTHPGGGVTGAPGHNAAREIIRDFKKGARRWKRV